ALLAKAERTQRQKAGRAPFGFDAWYWHTHAGELRREQGSETDAQFLAALRDAREWTDLRLLLRALKELHARPLLLGLPIAGPFYDYMGVGADARAAYYARLRATAASRGVPLLDFAERDGDLGFVVDRWSHPGRQASLAFDRALDAFYHGVLPAEAAATNG